MLKGLIIVGLGGAIGSMLRYIFTLLIRPSGFPYATLAVNLLGSLLIGIIIGFTLKQGTDQSNWKLFLATGLCGGFTTFSAFSLECIQLMEQQRYASMLGYIGLSLILGLAATFAGIQLSRI